MLSMFSLFLIPCTLMIFYDFHIRDFGEEGWAIGNLFDLNNDRSSGFGDIFIVIFESMNYVKCYG